MVPLNHLLLHFIWILFLPPRLLGIWGCSLDNVAKALLESGFLNSISTPVFSCFPVGKHSKSWVNTEGNHDVRVYVIFKTRNNLFKLSVPVWKMLHFNKGLQRCISIRNGGTSKHSKLYQCLSPNSYRNNYLYTQHSTWKYDNSGNYKLKKKKKLAKKSTVRKKEGKRKFFICQNILSKPWDIIFLTSCF